jgi:hypothetical protein
MSNLIASDGLAELVRDICLGEYSRKQLLQFVGLVQKISLSYLRYQEVLGKHIRWERRAANDELEDLAIDCIAGLFMRDEEGMFVQLKRYFQPRMQQADQIGDEELLVMLRRLVIKKTKQELSRIFKERDPEGAKIVRNIRVAIKNSDDLGCFRSMGRDYIYLKNDGHNPVEGTSGQNGSDNGVHHTHGTSMPVPDAHLRTDLPSIPERALRTLYLSVYRPKEPIAAAVRKMLAAVTEDEKYKNYLAIDQIARIMRATNYELAKHRLLNQFVEPSPLDNLRLKEIEEARQKVLKRIRQKIFGQYVRNRKLTPERGEVYYRALADLLDDISQGRKTDSYFHYLRRYLPDLTQRQYRTQERTIFEYLGKLVKRWLRDLLIELL